MSFIFQKNLKIFNQVLISLNNMMALDNVDFANLKIGAYKTCGICFDEFNLHPLNTVSSSKTAQTAGLYLSCGHGYCRECIAEHTRVVINSPMAVFPPTCPQIECDNIVQLELVRSSLSEKDRERWSQRMTETRIKNKIYCPNRKCSALHDGDRLKMDRLGSCICSSCGLKFCKTCLVKFHQGLTCSQYKALPEDERDLEDLQAIKLAESNKWRRCPSCRAIVELTIGCNHITCLCKHEL